MAARTDDVWKSSALTALYLEGVRGAIPLAAEQIDVMLRLLAGCGAVRRFLDIGCGDGVLAAAILDRYPDAEGVLIDFSPPMLEAAKHRFARKNGEVRVTNVDYGVPSWTRLVDDQAPYDAIVSGLSIHHQPDARKQEIYAEIFGMLRPGGIFVNIEHVSSASPWVEAVHDELFVDHLHRGHPGSERAEWAETYHNRPDKSANILAPVDTQCEWLRQIGFRDVDCFLKVFELAVFGGRRP